MITTKNLKRKLLGMARRWEKDLSELEACGVRMFEDDPIRCDELSEIDRNLSTAIFYVHATANMTDEVLETKASERFE